MTRCKYLSDYVCILATHHRKGTERIGLACQTAPGTGGGGTPSYGLYSYVRPQRVWLFSRFGHK